MMDRIQFADLRESVTTRKRSGRASVHCWDWIPRRVWRSPSYRGSPGRPALSAHIAEGKCLVYRCFIPKV